MKFFILYLVSGVTLFSASADNLLNSRTKHFFVGASIGYVNSPGTEYSWNYGISDGPASFSPGKGIGAVPREYENKVFVGYLKKLGKYLFSVNAYLRAANGDDGVFNAEGAVGSTSAGSPIFASVLDARLKQKTAGYGVEFQFGYMFSEKASLSAIVGYGWSPYSIEANLSYLAKTSVPPLMSSTSFSKSFYGGHLITGLKLSYFLDRNKTFFIAYRYNNFSGGKYTFKKQYTNSLGIPFSSTADIKKRGGSEEANIGFTYLFQKLALL